MERGIVMAALDLTPIRFRRFLQRDGPYRKRCVKGGWETHANDLVEGSDLSVLSAVFDFVAW